MSAINITLEGGTSQRLLTAGKYCDRDIVVTAEGGGGGSEIDALINGTITEVNSQAKFARAYSFYNCKYLAKANMPLATTVDTYAFQNCSALAEVNCPSVTVVGNYAFYMCGALVEANFPNAYSVGSNSFESCTSLVKADLFAQSYLSGTINSSAFSGCTSLTALILRKSSVATLSRTSALGNTPIASGTGYIYVPSALIDSYKAATNWTAYASQFRALEDYTVDGTVTGALDESKI